ncbi:MAG: glycosyltransferase family 39 protein [Bdellovibrionota bacterium]
MKRIFSLLGWIFALALLGAGLGNFHPGLSMDGPLYAAIARNFATGQASSLFHLTSPTPEFQPFFAEHPHLGFWTMAAVFKLLPATDWSARIPSQLFYILSLTLLYVGVSEIARSRRAAALTLILIWIFPILSNFFSNAYLDPEAFFFGTLAVFALERATRMRDRSWAWAVVSGLGLAGCALTKGFTVLGFGPAMAYLVISRIKARPGDSVAAASICLGSTVAVLTAYAFGISRSDVPGFLESYIVRQWSGRFAVMSDWSLLLRVFFYKEFVRETHGLLVLVPLLLVIRKKKFPAGDALWIPLIMIATFVLMYVPAARVGHQYWVMILPWAAVLIAQGLDALLPTSWTESRLRTGTASLALLLAALLPFLPIQFYRSRVPELAVRIRDATQSKFENSTRLWIEIGAERDTFIRSGTWAWYTGLPVSYASASALVSGETTIARNDVFVVEAFHDDAARAKLVQDLKTKNLCVGGENEKSVYWTHCF